MGNILICVINVSYIKEKRSQVNDLTPSFSPVGVTGFEPATTRPPDAYSNRAELHPELRTQRYGFILNLQIYGRLFRKKYKNNSSKAAEGSVWRGFYNPMHSRKKSKVSKIVSLSAVWLRLISPTSFSRVKLMTPAVFFLSCSISSYRWS